LSGQANASWLSGKGPMMLKVDIMEFQHGLCKPTAQAWLDILENSLKQIKDMDHIFHFFKPEKTFIEMWKRSSVYLLT
jgi:hypothetical protein